MAEDPKHTGTLALLPEKIGPTFALGQLVDVSKDMQPGMNRLGGRAKVTKAEGHGSDERYHVSYMVEVGGEEDLPLSALTAVSEAPDEARTRKSLQAAIQPVAEHEHQAVVDARDAAVERSHTLQQSLANRDAENTKLRSRLRDVCKKRRNIEAEKGNLLKRLKQENEAHVAEQAKVAPPPASHLQHIARKSILHHSYSPKPEPGPR